MKRICILLCMAVFALYVPSVGLSAFETSQQSPKKQKKIETVVFATHLHCENCVKKVQENIAYEKGVKSLEVSLEKQTITVGFDPSKTNAETLAAAIRKLGYRAEIN